MEGVFCCVCGVWGGMWSFVLFVFFFGFVDFLLVCQEDGWKVCGIDVGNVMKNFRVDGGVGGGEVKWVEWEVVWFLFCEFQDVVVGDI
jgi:hypothetical protein